MRDGEGNPVRREIRRVRYDGAFMHPDGPQTMVGVESAGPPLRVRWLGYYAMKAGDGSVDIEFVIFYDVLNGDLKIEKHWAARDRGKLSVTIGYFLERWETERVALVGRLRDIFGIEREHAEKLADEAFAAARLEEE
jgi:hypothetical protein